jgi:hypothetical protein
VWGSLLDHAQAYSCYGIGFHKQVLFREGGAPVFYMLRTSTRLNTTPADSTTTSGRS